MNTVVPGRRPGPAPLADQVGRGVAAAQSQRPRLVTARRPRHDVAAGAELLEGEQPDRLLAQRAVVAGLGRLEQVAGHLAQPVRAHPSAGVVDGDDRPRALAAQQHPDRARRPDRPRRSRRRRWRRTRSARPWGPGRPARSPAPPWPGCRCAAAPAHRPSSTGAASLSACRPPAVPADGPVPCSSRTAARSRSSSHQPGGRRRSGGSVPRDPLGQSRARHLLATHSERR